MRRPLLQHHRRRPTQLRHAPNLTPEYLQIHLHETEEAFEEGRRQPWETGAETLRVTAAGLGVAILAGTALVGGRPTVDLAGPGVGQGAALEAGVPGVADREAEDREAVRDRNRMEDLASNIESS